MMLISSFKKLLRNFLPLFIFFHPFQSNSRIFENYMAGARSLGLSNAFVSFSDLWSTFHNQAGLADIDDAGAGFYFESKFGISYLTFTAGSAVIPLKSGVFGISSYQFGKGAFKENKFALAFARALGKKWKAGIQMDYFTQRMPENREAAGCATFEGGIIYQPIRQLFLGLHLFNPSERGFDLPGAKIKMPATIRAGGHYQFDKNLSISFETERDNQHPLLYKTGVEFITAEKFAVRLGASGEPFYYTAGLGYIADIIILNIAFSYHGNLGMTPSVSAAIHL
jgi:hypothetical protein